MSDLYEGGTSEHGRPSFGLRNQESSSFREERMSKVQGCDRKYISLSQVLKGKGTRAAMYIGCIDLFAKII